MNLECTIVPPDPLDTEPGIRDHLDDDRSHPRGAAGRNRASPPTLMCAQQSIVVDRPVAEVFVFGSDLTKRCQWQRGTHAGQLLEPEVTELGARCVETRTAPSGATQEWELEVVAFERNGLLTVRADSDEAHIVEHHTFIADASSAGRTRYTLALEASGARWTAGDMQRQIVDHLIHLRDCLERPESLTAAALWRAPRARAKAAQGDAPADAMAGEEREAGE